MIRFIGLDGHSSSCTFTVHSEESKTIRTDVVETNGQSLVSTFGILYCLYHDGRRRSAEKEIA